MLTYFPPPGRRGAEESTLLEKTAKLNWELTRILSLPSRAAASAAPQPQHQPRRQQQSSTSALRASVRNGEETPTRGAAAGTGEAALFSGLAPRPPPGLARGRDGRSNHSSAKPSAQPVRLPRAASPTPAWQLSRGRGPASALLLASTTRLQPGLDVTRAKLTPLWTYLAGGSAVDRDLVSVQDMCVARRWP